MADTKQQAPDLPVYLFTGFLEAGKTKFIQETLEDNRFHKGERTLLLLCEEGEEVYEPDKFCAGNVYVRNIDEESDLTVEHLKALQDEIQPERVLVEYNGMWMLDSLYGNLPEGWAVAQEFLFCDATSFLSYNANMRQLTVDKLKSAELVVLNRYNDSMDRMEMHRVIRAISRRCDIAYEYTDGKVVYDDIEDPLPFDLTHHSGSSPEWCRSARWTLTPRSSRSRTATSPSGTATCPKSRRSTTARPLRSSAAASCARTCRRAASSPGGTS